MYFRVFFLYFFFKISLIFRIMLRSSLNLIKNFNKIEATSFYHANVLEHYKNPKNVGSLDKDDPTIGTGLVGAPACGDVMKLQIKV